MPVVHSEGTMTRAELRAMGERALDEGELLGCPNLLYVPTIDYDPEEGARRDGGGYDEGTWLAVDHDPCPGCTESHVSSCHNKGKAFDKPRRLLIVKTAQ